MAKICLISHGHPSSNPRLVRDADVLAEAGYAVSVVTPQYMARWLPYDESLVRMKGWKFRGINYLSADMSATWRWNYIRIRRRICAFVAKWMPFEGVIGRACNYSNPELADLAASEPADLYIAHQHHALPAAAWAARITKSRFAFDAEDLLAESSAEPHNMIIDIEKRYLHDCAYISTMSHDAADRLQVTNSLKERPLVLHNTPRIKEREGAIPPIERPLGDVVSIYWFGQTIGTHSCADQVLKALPLLCKPVRIVLRGTPRQEYVNYLMSLTKELGLEGRLEILPIALADEMVRLAAQYDILLGSQPGDELFHQMAIGNKVFTGMMAGLALALTNTIAHRELLANAPGCGFLFKDSDVQELANRLNTLLSQPSMLLEMKQASWRLAQERFNWEIESKQLITTVAQVKKDK